MSKELPYFRFTAFEWLNDDISLEDYETKGVFIDICAYYWFKDCSITKAMLEKRFSNAIPVIEALLKSGIIKFKNGDDFIEISFLNDQFDQLSELRKRRQDAGAKGGKQRSSKAKAKLKQRSSYKDKDKEKDNNKEITEVEKTWLKWKEYKKKEFKFSYKSDVSEEAAKKQLIELAGNDAEIAIKIIEQSISNGWKGFFKLKNNNNGITGKSIGATDEELARFFATKYGIDSVK